MEYDSLDRTENNDKNNRGQINKKDLKTEIYPVWQEFMDEDRTFYSVNETSTPSRAMDVE